MTPFRIVLATDLMEDGLRLLQAPHDMQVEIVPPTPEAVRESLKHAHALIFRNELTIDKALLQAAPRLKVIARLGVSVNNIDLNHATAQGIMVMNTPGSSATAVAEYTLGLLLALSRKLFSAHTSMKEGRPLLERKQLAGTQLSGKTIGLVGIGRVGQEVALRCLAFGMDVLAYDPYLNEDHLTDERITLVALDDLLEESDIISLHAPLTAETLQMFNAERLAQVKSGAYFINTAQSGMVDEAALAEALQSGQIAGAAVDVLTKVPPYDSPLLGLPNVIHTPHSGDNTVEAAQDVSVQVANQVMDALRGRDYRHVVNLPFMPGSDFETARPYMRLAECLGAMLHTLARNPIRRVAVEVRGEDVSNLVKPIAIALLKGLLYPMLGDKVNSINAPFMAAERHIQVTQTKGLKTADYANLVSCQVSLEQGEDITISGTLLDRSEPHIVQINQYRMNLVPEGDMLILGSFDRPGVIGTVGSLMAANHVNIAGWHTGRAERGGQTLSIVSLDHPIPAPVLEAIRQLNFIRHAHPVVIPKP